MKDFPRDLLNLLMDDLDEAVFFTDSDGIVRYLNEPAAYIIRLPALTAAGRAMERLLPAEVAAFLQQEGREALATGVTRRLHRKSLILPGRGLLFFDIRIAPYRQPGGGAWIAYQLLDITARERRKIASDRARENAEAEARARRGFLARMSHEIRTPMNGIMGMTDLALNSSDREEIEEYLEVIKNASDSLLGIINDVLDYSKIESGRLEPEQIPIQPSLIVEEILALLAPLAEEKNLVFQGAIEDSVPDTVIGDPVRLRQIITNLAGNALKFTDSGSVTVRIECPGNDGKSENLLLTGAVEDTGIGIEEDKMDDLFEPFAQSDISTNREYGGTGLGLAISRNLARLMGGDVDAVSVPGEGSVFTFRVKVRRAAEGVRADSAAPAASALAGMPTGNLQDGPEKHYWAGERILLAEDNRVNRIVAEQLLRRVGLEPLPCENGEEAVEVWSLHRPAVILMDLQMPVMDGLEASRRIRKIEARDRTTRTPIIALTAHVLEEEKKEARKAGMNGWVTKPVKPEDLYAELARVLPPVVSPV